ncbi:Putative NAD(P)H nitroreductase YdjA [Variovorax sp. PBS-H4]|uniref:nitroreductase family protein n=1 Tax=Variovorax sp. PBS-H4 TaxID=434008 RepID=UPI0013187E6B|nr:nitroreductase family protein [Variovorax sp. PBS-H4]VTU36171.1 Putative NAD(P)H nitroreductase YdjA [Variovorax sp. PBS-H4]
MHPGTNARPLSAAPLEAAPPEAVAALMAARRTVLPKRLVTPGPGETELAGILAAAATAPDHGGLVPWRFVVIPGSQRHRLADAFEHALVARDGEATAAQRAQAREKAFRAPVLMLAIATLGPDNEDIPPTERLLSAGCAIQNILLMSTALGFGSALTTGKAITSPGLRALFSLAEGEEALCFISIGTVLEQREGRARPSLDRFVTRLGD